MKSEKIFKIKLRFPSPLYLKKQDFEVSYNENITENEWQSYYKCQITLSKITSLCIQTANTKQLIII